MQTKEFTLPTYVLPYLANGDIDHLTETELEELEDFLTNNGLNNASFDYSEEYFSYRNALSGLGSDVVDITFFIQS